MSAAPEIASPLPAKRGEGQGEGTKGPSSFRAEDRQTLGPLTPTLSPPGGEREAVS